MNQRRRTKQANQHSGPVPLPSGRSKRSKRSNPRSHPWIAKAAKKHVAEKLQVWKEDLTKERKLKYLRAHAATALSLTSAFDIFDTAILDQSKSARRYQRRDPETLIK
jgi:hypothetical protein